MRGGGVVNLSHRRPVAECAQSLPGLSALTLAKRVAAFASEPPCSGGSPHRAHHCAGLSGLIFVSYPRPTSATASSRGPFRSPGNKRKEYRDRKAIHGSFAVRGYASAPANPSSGSFPGRAPGLEEVTLFFTTGESFTPIREQARTAEVSSLGAIS